MAQKGFMAEKTKKQPKLLLNNAFTVGWELREHPVPETMINKEGKTVPFVAKYRDSMKGGYDAYKANTKTLLKASLYFLIFLLPVLVLIFYGYAELMKYYTISGGDFMGNVGVGYPGDISNIGQIVASRIYAYQIFFLYFLPCVLIISLGMAGLFNVAKKIIWDEPFKYTAKPFFNGIKKYWWKYMLFVMFGSAIALSMGSALLYLLKAIELNVANAGHYCACIFTFIFGAPLLVFPMVALTIIPSYKLSFGQLIKDSFVIAINRFVPYAFVGILSCIPIGLMAINSILSIVIVIVLLAFGFSLWAMLWTGLGHGSYLKCVYLNDLTNQTVASKNPYEAKKATDKTEVDGKIDKKPKKQTAFVNPKKKKKK